MSTTLTSVHNALEILHLLRQRGPLRLSEIAAGIGVGTSTAHRLISTLREQRFVRQQPGGKRYELGSAMLFSSGVSVLEHCVTVSAQIMEQLQECTQETVHLSVLRGTTCLFAASYPSQRRARVTSRVGQGPPAHTAAGGKVLLAALEADRLLELLPNDELEAVTEHSIITRSALLQELEGVRQFGFARNLGESEIDMYALAVPIRRPRGEVIASLTIAAPLSRIDPALGIDPASHELLLLEALREAARRIESLLAY
ncbi:MAG: IclR family transcriptional regulator [Leucobacter sp.]